MELKKAITTGLHRTMGGRGFETRAGGKWLRGSWRREEGTAERARVRRRKGENGKMEKKGQWSQYSCHGGDKQRQRLSDKNSTYKRQLRGTKAEWQPIPAWRRVSRNPVIHSNLYDDVAEPHRWCHRHEYSSGDSELSAKSFHFETLGTLPDHVELQIQQWLITVIEHQ